MNFVRPINPARATSGWGVPRPYRDGIHQGLDFHAPRPGRAIFAIAPGEVTVARYDKDKPAGMWIQVTHADGWQSEYMHLSQLRVKKGQWVMENQIIGLSGATGIKQSAAHLHFQLRKNGALVPSEPHIPADSYESDVIANAKAHKLALRGVQGGGSPGILAGLSLALIFL